MLGGFLLDNFDIYYFSFKLFIISNYYILLFGSEYLDIDDKSLYYLIEKEIRDIVEVNKIKDFVVKSVLIEKLIEYMNKFNFFMRFEIV